MPHTCIRRVRKHLRDPAAGVYPWAPRAAPWPLPLLMKAPFSSFARYAWAVLAFNVLVVLWGAVVRATDSGAGCGRHWPKCNGQILPEMASIHTRIEFGHRITSGIALLLVVGMLVWARRAFAKGHPARRGAWLSFFFILVEAGVGAGVVLFRLVADNKSIERAISTPTHLVTTFLLLGALTLTVWWGSGGADVRIRRQGTLGAVLLTALFATILVGATGALTALGDTLFPKTTVGFEFWRSRRACTSPPSAGWCAARAPRIPRAASPPR